MKQLKHIIIEIHNASGSFMSLMFVFWCISGIVLIFDGFPHASLQERFAFLETMNEQDCQALQAPSSDFKGELSLEMAYGKPVYRLKTGRKAEAVYDAMTLERLGAFSEAQIKSTASAFLGAEVKQVELRHDLDAWMPWSYYKALLPIYKCEMADSKHTVLYISQQTGTIVQQTDRPSRWSARFGAIPHWIYFKRLRLQVDKWRSLVIILSSLGVLMTLSGIIAGFIRMKKKSQQGLTPYKKSWYKWHHLFGLFFGLFVFAFILSGLVSVTSVPDVLVGIDATKKSKIAWDQTVDFSVCPVVSPALLFSAFDNKENIRKVVWVSAFDEFQFHVYRTDYQEAEVYVYQKGKLEKRQPSSPEDLSAYAKKVLADVPYRLRKQENYDAYYSGSAMQYLPVPVYKLEVDDEEKTWLYINPADGQQVYKLTKPSRYRRWLYRFLHTFDVPVLKAYDAVRKALLLILCLGCLALSLSGLVLSFNYYKRLLKTHRKR